MFFRFKKSYSVLTLGLFILGCGGDESPSVSKTSSDTQVSHEETLEPTTFVEESELHLLRTRQPITSLKPNRLSLKGKGFQKTYEFHYRFNSDTSNQFKLMSTKKEVNAKNCEILPQAKMTLVGGGESKKIDLTSKTSLIPHTDYRLIFSFGPVSCDSIEINHDIVAWADADAEKIEPKFAHVCQGKQIPTIAFFPRYRMLTAYNYETRQEFLSDHNYCGQMIAYFKSPACIATEDAAIKRVTCSEETEAVAFDFILNSNENKANLNCTSHYNSQKKSIFQEEFTQCQEMILDLNVFKDGL